MKLVSVIKSGPEEHKSNEPLILLSQGDANGVGPEILLKIYNETNFFMVFNLKIAGSKKILDYYAQIFNLNEIPSELICEIPASPKFDVKIGEIDKSSGKYSGDCIKAAAKMCLEKKADAIVTLPISKEALNLGGYNFNGHTEMLTSLSNAFASAMILYSKKIAVSLATIHIPVEKVKAEIEREKLIERIILINNSLIKDFKKVEPRIAVLGLNPHAGDGGMIGKEEEEVILPTIKELRDFGFNIQGPFPSDGFFATGKYKNYDLTFAMYHDQGLIPFKMLAFDKGVNFTAGLDFVRTSPDHGTAYDIAGRGVANIKSTLKAIKLARKIAKNRNLFVVS
ncbi:MAG: 4-hydroxythreonine-4-phosphate dehydrogenase PdxA [Ignavibacteria bacterium]|nr:4-hydroxythreonine-4-phosphate dehydrogenase PdxA [Ignavibacteria bacterium]